MAFFNFLTAEQQAWRESCYRYMEREITREYIRECDMAREYYYEGYRKIVEQGWHSLLIPPALGGSGAGPVEYALMCEAGGRYGYDFVAAVVGTPSFNAQNLIKFGNEDQLDRFIKPYVRGDIRFSIGISEPQAGSDAAATATRAVRDGDHYVVTGAKQWISGSGAQNAVILMLVRTDPSAPKHQGLSMILIPNDLPGIQLNKLKTLARRGMGTYQVFLDEVRVPAANLLGAEGQGWEIIGANLELERIACAAGYVGCAQQAVDDALLYAHQREQFGQPIYQFQVIKHMLADMQTEVDAARLVLYRAAATVEAGQPALREVSMAKLLASETLQKVSRQGVQIMGGHGMLPEADMERYFREGMQSTIGGGTSQIQRSIIAKTMHKALMA
ncbi:acyl-CoA dehydrogenase family protein [Phytohabitans sp. ZYX-F-186]|uniref:Medium-chain specific acyl-CoA dehydrogenase, mitochondrial n=1 Tax=Phytohabitans maris TaxID=3071409 RepID=A0ABU0ZUX6_9ACTN|nr:acyl-CoA dehydrogenase family protein [Phytohabitans sp. ZYX-F-186]MDQ7910846.1 acyl-CoA dehydrogenase family protein [Phytohabitans sp. ZYX-F-186]